MTIKEVFFTPPLDNPAEAEFNVRLVTAQAKELGIGRHDVTPSGYRDKYEVLVRDPGNGDNVGELVVTRRGGKTISSGILDKNDFQLDQSYRRTKRVPLNAKHPMIVLSRPIMLDDPKKEGARVHGVIYYDPQG